MSGTASASDLRLSMLQTSTAKKKIARRSNVTHRRGCVNARAIAESGDRREANKALRQDRLICCIRYQRSLIGRSRHSRRSHKSANGRQKPQASRLASDAKRLDDPFWSTDLQPAVATSWLVFQKSPRLPL